MNARNTERFFEKETPVYVPLKGGEIRLYKECGRFSLSKPQWIDKEGNEQLGKTVTINLKANAGNTDLIEVLQSCISLLQETPEAQEGGRT